MNEEQMERAIDRRVQARLATDRDYLWAENADEQAWAETKIELQEELGLLRAQARPTPAEQRRIEDVETLLEQHLDEHSKRV